MKVGRVTWGIFNAFATLGTWATACVVEPRLPGPLVGAAAIMAVAVFGARLIDVLEKREWIAGPYSNAPLVLTPPHRPPDRDVLRRRFMQTRFRLWQPSHDVTVH
jgi:hypothetical protein